MRYLYLFIAIVFGVLLFSNCQNTNSASQQSLQEERPEYAIVIHGGAGTIDKLTMSTAREAAYTKALNEALNVGEEILKNGGSAIDAVEKTIMVMENYEGFNAGKGAVFTHDATNEMDASIMEGKNLEAGAVGGLTNIKNPINAARLVLDKSEHVLLTGTGARIFAILNGLDTVPSSYFFTQGPYDRLQNILKREKERSQGYNNSIQSLSPFKLDEKFGTVGCVALDKDGNIAAGTSTGGMTNKKYDRFGDSPIIGAGTYANNATCGVSCTGHGEYFIRHAVAYDVHARMDYLNESIQAASEYIINDKLEKIGGAGGLIALDKDGNVAMPFNTSGMFRGYAKPRERVVLMYEN